MPVRKQSPYGPFVEYVVLPAIRIGLLLLSILAIGFGSWLETNDQLDCSFKSSVSLHQVFLYRNITSNTTTPDSVSFGLWKHCYIYSHNCSCSPTNLRYQPDVSTILQVATEHNATAPITTIHSLSRVIPLILATLFGACAFLLGLYTNKRGKYLYRRITVGLISATTVLVTYSFGYSYQRYYRMIKDTCESDDNDVYCARHVVQTEVVLFALALGFLFFALVFWISASSFLSKSANDSVGRDDLDHLQPQIHQSVPKRVTTLPQDELAVWRDVTMLDSEDHWDEKKMYSEEHLGYKRKNSRHSSHLYEKPSLSPPPAAASAGNRHNRHSKKKPDPKRHHLHQLRKESNDSALTFGGNHWRKSSLDYSDWEQRFQTSRLNLEDGGGYARKTPTSMSPHPENQPRGSYCMTPQLENHDGYFPQQRNDHRKSSTNSLNRSKNLEHPLNKKAIVDKRIQDYFSNNSNPY